VIVQTNQVLDKLLVNAAVDGLVVEGMGPLQFVRAE
jgi:L-asparaginase/Glu-tRNA(Gln) amidotransferase subunit D